ncbi:MFS transporter [Rubrobacter marinus]|uniref:MFS transporter n=1 Tax=Rubrobacter marinus TaxID=2653852 RepID=A0A6G8PS92_9ACTN|nr:MFS transporter [Rubrobacter marinus]QIN77349.1 MFS transporter [Rubrobacter marinus]
MRDEGRTLLTGAMLALVSSTLASLVGFNLLLSVVPLYANEVGGGSTGAGFATAAFMLSTVLAQTQMPRALSRFGYRPVLAAGLLSLGLPAFAYATADGLPAVLAVTLARGVGFGIVTVVFGAVVVEIAPAERRGEALGLFGIAIALPAIFCNPLSLWLVERSGYEPVFLLGGAAPLLGFVSFLGLGSVRGGGRSDGAGFLEGLARPPLLRLVVIFAVSTMVGGVLVTFLPLAAPGVGVFSAATAILALGISVTLGRLWAGRFADRNGPRGLLAPGLVLAALGVATLAQGGPALLVGAALFGLGFGALQSATLVMIMARVSKEEYGLGSTLWNAAFDAGTGLGAFLFGFVVGASGFSIAFYLCAALLLAALVVVRLDRAATGPA